MTGKRSRPRTRRKEAGSARHATSEVLKALADPTRAVLLDRLFERDGQTLVELTAALDLTRFGVMKHLRVLEDAGLVTTRRAGRTKLHYLNPVPIRLVHDRWIGKFAEPWVRGMSALKRDLEEIPAMSAPKHVYEVFIRSTPEAVWKALTDPDVSRQYFFGTAFTVKKLAAGEPYTYVNRNGQNSLEGKILEVDPPRKLSMTFIEAHDEVNRLDPPSRVTWTIEPRGDAVKLTLVHDEFATETRTYKSVGGGWPTILSGLKTLLETGEPLVIGGAKGA